MRFKPTLEAWREAVRPLLAANIAPEDVDFLAEDAAQTALPGLTLPTPAAPAASAVRVPRAFLSLAEDVACHRDGRRWALLYRTLVRLGAGDRAALEDPLDVDGRALSAMAKAVNKDVHRMHAFVRFRQVDEEQGSVFVAWHQPDHLILHKAAPFFVARFSGMRWRIHTPDASAVWDGNDLQYLPGVPHPAAVLPDDDALEPLWRGYYAATFNPARANLAKTTADMPRRYWRTMPETQLIAPLLAEANTRTQQMIGAASNESATRWLPTDSDADLATLARAACACRGCPLAEHATQTVFGEGPSNARIMLVGEQPGDEEDRAGKPFVGPAGAVLNDALRAVGLNRADVYITNAVKHFKYVQSGPRRLHQRPRGRETQACRPWLMAEIDRVRPQVLVALGATAAQSLFGPQTRPAQDRGRPIASDLARLCLVTYHPSAVLRARESASHLRACLVADLERAAEHVQATAASRSRV